MRSNGTIKMNKKYSKKSPINLHSQRRVDALFRLLVVLNCNKEHVWKYQSSLSQHHGLYLTPKCIGMDQDTAMDRHVWNTKRCKLPIN